MKLYEFGGKVSEGMSCNVVAGGADASWSGAWPRPRPAGVDAPGYNGVATFGMAGVTVAGYNGACTNT